MKCVVVNYGMGNLAFVSKALKKIGIDHRISADPDEIELASYIILPGVGSFQAAMHNLKVAGIDEALKSAVNNYRANLFGICLGMQLLAEKGYEPEECEGLGFIKGEVRLIESDLPVPHMGWNNITVRNSQLFNDIPYDDFYFVHSYHFAVQNESDIAATVNYGVDFVCAVQKERVFGCQFHPEKSQLAGLKVLENFFASNA